MRRPAYGDTVNDGEERGGRRSERPVRPTARSVGHVGSASSPLSPNRPSLATYRAASPLPPSLYHPPPSSFSSHRLQPAPESPPSPSSPLPSERASFRYGHLPLLHLDDDDSESLLTSMASFLQSPDTNTVNTAPDADVRDYRRRHHHHHHHHHHRRRRDMSLPTPTSSTTHSTTTTTTSSASPLTTSMVWPALLSPDTQVFPYEYDHFSAALSATSAAGVPMTFGAIAAAAESNRLATHRADRKLEGLLPDYLFDTGYASLIAAAQREAETNAANAAAASAAATGSGTDPPTVSALSTTGSIPGHFVSFSTSVPGSLAELAGHTGSTGSGSGGSSEHEDILPPTQWNAKDRCQLLEVSRDGLGVTYIGSGKSDSDAAALRANRPMPAQSGIFYFEVLIVSKGRDGYIGIGFSSREVSLRRLPGWEQSSWGYHGDDGHKFCCSGTGQRFGPTFTTGDVIGCCVNFVNHTSFFTKNGINLGTAFTDLKGTLYPSIGMRTPQEQIQTNFGHKPFMFDIGQYVREEKQRLWHVINTAPLPPLPASAAAATTNARHQGMASVIDTQRIVDTGSISAGHQPRNNGGSAQQRYEDALPNTVKELALAHLIHHGYRDSAQAFAREALSLPWDSVLERLQPSAHTAMSDVSVSQEEEEEQSSDASHQLVDEVQLRREIYDAVIRGDIKTAKEMTERHFSGVLNGNGRVLFELRCQEFIELMRRCSTKSVDDAAQPMEVDADNTVMTTRSGKSLSTNGSGSSGSRRKRAATEEDDDDEDEYDDEDEHGGDVAIGRTHDLTLNSAANNNNNSNDYQFDLAMQEAMEYGQKLQEDYQNDQRTWVREALVDVFSLFAYFDPSTSVVAHLLDPARREPVATNLNNAIVGSLGRSTMSPLERAYRQSAVALRTLTQRGVAGAGLLDLKRDGQAL